MAQWWPVSYKLHYSAFGGSQERDDAIVVHQKSMDRMRGLVRKDNLLEWKVQDGSGPLCDSLGKKQPQGTFPRVNEGAEFVVLIEDIRRDLLTKAAKRAGQWVTALRVVGMGVCWAMKGVTGCGKEGCCDGRICVIKCYGSPTAE